MKIYTTSLAIGVGIGIIVAITISVVFLLRSGSISQEAPASEIFRTMQNLYLEPGQTEDSNHPIMLGQVVEITIEPYSNDANIPDYELLVTMVDPSGETIINKFISEPFHVKLRPAHPGWHAIIVTNIGETGIAPGTSIESRPYDKDADEDVEFAIECIVPPSVRNEENTPFPWC